MTHIRIPAPAKLNLFLHITGKRPDGYHLLESLVAFTDFGDVIDIEPAHEITLEMTGPFASSLSQGDNLVLRAAHLLQSHCGIKNGAHITLHKHIPIGAGLGGGSADAAAVLKGLQQLWGAEFDEARALELGSDVPVCLVKKAAWVTGIGEKIAPVDIPADISVVLVNPNIPLMTADVYRAFSGEFAQPLSPVKTIESLDSLTEQLRVTHNALEQLAKALLPVIGDIIAALDKTRGCAMARMSGSGATCFGLYADDISAKNAAMDLKKKYPAWWVMETRLYG